ncbi:hypothetical protein BU16DRAFT_612226 [Lophium mytilinum]|uniref:DUF3074 domain-containing protein n=1 Tax=Lophium mytilinum TaxID=390894 RepID=A0A6A6RDT7_9PEZI|nr:hypothetical protein BU16DRAFT_612226 [Lophium mytilinum]
MSKLHSALETLRPKEYSDVPLDDLKGFLADIFSSAEVIANSVPPLPGGSDFESSQRSRSDVNGATCAAEVTVSKARAPPPAPDQAELQKGWGKPLKLSAKDTATGITVFKMAGHDRHGAWFARKSVHEGLGFEKWKRAMMSEFPESLAVQGGPGEGNIRGIGGDKRLESEVADGVGKMEVYQLSAQFPGPTTPREFITLLLTSDHCLSEASKIGDVIPRHFMVVSIPVNHPDAPPRNGLIRGYYESVEMVREIPLARPQHSASTTDLLKPERSPSRARGSTIGFAESRGPKAKGERIDRQAEASDDDPETNPVEWIMITRSDPGGGIPRFMVERNTPSSIVTDAGKFLDWACSKDEFPGQEEREGIVEEESTRKSFESARKSFDSTRSFPVSQANGYLAGVGTSIADQAVQPTHRDRSEHRRQEDPNVGVMASIASTMESAYTDYAPDAVQRAFRSDSVSSSSTEVSSLDSFASAEQFTTAEEEQAVKADPGTSDSGSQVNKLLQPGSSADPNAPTPSSISTKSLPLSPSTSATPEQTTKELQKIEQKRKDLEAKIAEDRQKQTQHRRDVSQKELEKVSERHSRDRKKQEDKYAKEVRKLEERRERETRKLLAKQQKEEDKNELLKTQKERDDWKVKAEASEKEVVLLREQIGELQRENTAIVAKIGRMEGGIDVLRKVKEDMEGGRTRASSRASAGSRGSKESKRNHLGDSH